ncbi:MAG: ribosome maturation factor RimM [SAR324 cluster bacterium]|nr:ribosome maturation factor RimM [SAR324 cluster bacterium]
MEGYTHIGNIFNVHGIKGELKVAPLSEDIDFLSSLKVVYLQFDGEFTAVKVGKIRPHKSFWLLVLAGVADRNKAESLKGQELFVPDEMIKPLDDGEFFIHEVIGKEVYSTDDELLGTVEGYFENGEQMVFEVKGVYDFMFPAVDEILISVEDDRVIIKPVEGLLDLNQKSE